MYDQDKKSNTYANWKEDVIYVSKTPYSFAELAETYITVRDQQAPLNKPLQQVPQIQPAKKHKLCHPINLYHSY